MRLGHFIAIKNAHLTVANDHKKHAIANIDCSKIRQGLNQFDKLE